ncbi:hypothetical protein AWZ03_014410 [Drosophila navojoa]|uniref:PPM-type phosphatase domain-containing protein n=1 Tax=Drosophila navojoa TaxID=7232 RepID=A0A484ART7_DRONA|nr:protein phosphatase 1H [Drosophila navojoa]TDG39166.1 hypothetical protein AWZ03_014410 [Drosophila navojoa]
MLNNFKNRFISAIEPDLSSADLLPDKFPYGRPPFLQLLTADELRASANHNVRPIIVPRDLNLLPWGTGYAECINSGKSKWNEDQAAFCRQVLTDPEKKYPDLPYTYFGIFDGHAGYGAALAASHQFHDILHEMLVDCSELLLPRDQVNDNSKSHENPTFPHPTYFQRRVSRDELIIGALESAFFHMDWLISQDRNYYRDAGGCTACVTLFIDGKMYVANAGDSRAVLCQRRAGAGVALSVTQSTANPNKIEPNPMDGDNSYPTAYSADHTPETERERLMNVARLKPQLMGQHYVAMEYAKRPHITDMGKRILCRQGTMKGWTYKTLTRNDLRIPVVNGEGKRSRLLGTLGVTRGFGDHDLLAINTGVQIKPFLTPHPDVRQRDLSQVVSIPDEHNEDGDYGILVMATDGLWDVSENDAVSRIVFQMLSRYPREKHRYTMAAQELVARARGKINDSGHWRLADSKAAATVDDISVIVIPVYQYYKEHIEWTHNDTRELERRRRKAAEDNMAQEAVNAFNDIAAEEAHVVEERRNLQQQPAIVKTEQVIAGPKQEQERQKQDQHVQSESEETLVEELNDNSPLQARLESVSETLQQVHLEARTKAIFGEITAPTAEASSAVTTSANKQRSNRKGKGNKQ